MSLLRDRLSVAAGNGVPHGLQLRGISKQYGDQVAVDGVDIDVGPGRFVTLLGPSGSGKTTLLMIIAGFVAPTRGDVLLDGRMITALPPERRNFGMVFQGYALFPQMTAEENVWFPLRVRGIGRRQARRSVQAILELVQMTQFARRLPSELSGGQQQRIALARALVFQPTLLLLDEPLSALDKRLRAELQWELSALHRRLGATFLNVTHDQEEALSMSDDIVILREGRVEQAGRPADLYARPATRFVASFLGESNFILAAWCGADGDRWSYTVRGEAFVQSGVCPRPDTGLLLALRPEKIAVAPAPPDRVNRVHGHIADFKFFGSGFLLQVETATLGRMVVKTGSADLGFEPAIDCPVWLGWNPDAAVPVRPD